MSVGNKMTEGMRLDREAYEAYADHTGWKSLATGQPLPPWDELPAEIRRAWQVSTAWVVGRVLRREDSQG